MPLPLHFRSTGSVLLPSGDSRAIGSLNTAARLCTGPVALGLTDGGVLPRQRQRLVGAVGGVIGERQVRLPRAGGLGLERDGDRQRRAGCSVVPSMPVPEIVKSPGLRPAR